jgi:hypothetical protein
MQNGSMKGLTEVTAKEYYMVGFKVPFPKKERKLKVAWKIIAIIIHMTNTEVKHDQNVYEIVFW